MAAKTPPARRIILGGWLRAAREAAGYTVKTAAAALETDAAQISRSENGLRLVRPGEVLKLLDIYGVKDPARRARMKHLSQSLSRKDWFDRYDSVLDERGARDWLSLEQHAVWLRSYALSVVPGLIQTDQYARAIFTRTRSGKTDDEIGQLVAARIERQRRLDDETSFRFRIVMDEAVLHRTIGGKFVHRAQLQRLVDITEGAIPAVTLQVLPFSVGAHDSLDGAFTILGFDHLSIADLVCVEGRRAGVVLSEPDDLRDYANTFDQLMETALSAADSRDLIDSVIKEM